jgi:hypothetical protein
MKPSLPLCHEVLAVNPTDPDALHSFLLKNHGAYNQMLHDNPELSREQVAQTLIASCDGDCIADLATFNSLWWRLYMIVIPYLDEQNINIEGINALLHDWGVSPALLIPEGERSPYHGLLTNELSPKDMFSGMEIFRRCAIEIYESVESLTEVKKVRKVTDSDFIRAVESLNAGEKTISQICRELGITRRAYYKRLNYYKK